MDYSLAKAKKTKAPTSTKCRLTLAALVLLGLALLVGGSVIYAKVFPQVLRQKVAEKLTLTEGSEAEERFHQAPVPIFGRFYFFNVTNKDDINLKGARPILQEIGPYVFRVDQIRNIEQWNPDKGTLNYHEVKRYHFDKELSKGDLSDRINHVNAVSIALGSMLQKQAAVFRALGMSVDEMISEIRGDFIDTHTLDELLFGGFSIRNYFPEESEHLCRLKHNCTFSFWKNNTKSKMFEINTGANNIDDVTVVLNYNNESALPYWQGEQCNSINGTVGPQFKPGLAKGESFYAFAPEICRSMEFMYAGSSDVKGIPTMRFTIRDDALFYSNPPNKCFCPEDENCDNVDGVMFAAPCHEGGPVAVSWPHFYLSPPEYARGFEGIKPDKTKHSTFVDIEPITGSALAGYKRLQANIVVKPDPRIKLLKHIKKTVYFPVFWAEESGVLDEANASKLRSQLFIPLRVGKWSLLSAMILGALLLLIALVSWTFKRK